MVNWDKYTKDTGIRALSKIGLANIIGTAISAVFWFYMAPVLGTEAYGQLGYFISIVVIAGGISLFGAGNVLMVYLPKSVDVEGVVFTVAIAGSVVSSVILYFMFNQIGLGLFVIGFAIFHLVIGDTLGRKFYRKYFIYFVSQKIVFLVLTIGMYYVLGLEGIILGWGMSYLLYGFIIYKIFKNAKINFKVYRKKLGFISKSYTTDLIGTLSSHSDRLILGGLFGFALLGNYQFSIQILAVCFMLPTIIFQYILPRESSGLSNNKLKTITVLISVFIVILTVLASPIVVPLLVPQFEESILILQIGILSLIPKTIISMQISKFLSVENSHDVLISTTIYLVLQISGIFVLGEFFGIYGAAAALVLGSVGQATYLILMQQKLKIKS